MPVALPLDLNAGSPDGYVSKTEYVRRNPERVDALLGTLGEAYTGTAGVWSDMSAPPHIVTWRGILTKLLMLAKSPNDSFELDLIRHQVSLSDDFLFTLNFI